MAATRANPETMTWLRLLRLYEQMHGNVADFLRRWDLSLPQYNVLRILRGAGDKGLHCRQISERMITRVPDITRLLDRLEHKELIARQRSSSDRRIVMVSLTEGSLRLLSTLDGPLNDLHRRQFSVLPRRERQQLNQILDQLLTA